MQTYPRLRPYMRFLFVRPEICPLGDLSTPKIRLSSDSASRRTPLPLAKSSRYRATSGLSPYRMCAHRAHKKNRPPYGHIQRAISYFHPKISICSSSSGGGQCWWGPPACGWSKPGSCRSHKPCRNPGHQPECRECRCAQWAARRSPKSGCIHRWGWCRSRRCHWPAPGLSAPEPPAPHPGNDGDGTVWRRTCGGYHG